MNTSHVGQYRFDHFVVDTDNRSLHCHGKAVELNARYFDALVLLLERPGQLVSKDQFMQEVWQGVPVTDEALTQCIRTLRRQLGDSARAPRYIETVPKHGYRFIGDLRSPSTASKQHFSEWFLRGAVGTLGAGSAGLMGGFLLGLMAILMAPVVATNQFSVLIVAVSLSVLIGLLGGAGVAFGHAVAEFWLRIRHIRGYRRGIYRALGAAIGGGLVGALVSGLSVSILATLFGASPDSLTGSFEGILLGACMALAYHSAVHYQLGLKTSAAVGIVGGCVAAILINLTDGVLLTGSLRALAVQFPESSLARIGFGEWFASSPSQAIISVVIMAIEAGLFSACFVIAMRRLDKAHPNKE